MVALPIQNAYGFPMPSDESAVPQFPATRWSVVLTASAGGTNARAALEELCRLYWFPLYSFARQQGCSPEDAEDETQAFLAHMAAGDILSTAAQDKGHLRTYLLAAFQRDLIDAHRRATRQKRGGNMEFISLEALNAEERYRSAPRLESPAATYDRAWAMTCLDAAVQTLESEYAARGRIVLFQALSPFLDPESGGDYAIAAKATGLDPNALRQAVFRLRQRFRIIIRQTIADTLEHPSDGHIDEELAALRAALTR